MVKSKEDISSASVTTRGFIQKSGLLKQAQNEVCVEEIFDIFLNDTHIASLVASPTELRELGAGYVITEGLAQNIDDVVVSDRAIYVSAGKTFEPVRAVTESGGGMQVGHVRRKIVSRATITRDEISQVISGIVSKLWQQTGGAHCSVLFCEGNMVAKSSDVGRHNTVDKVVGFATLNDIDLSACVLGCTGRQPKGMVSKAINAGIPIIISKAATTDKGIVLAREAGLTLICRVKQDKFAVYSHPQRVKGPGEFNMEPD